MPARSTAGGSDIARLRLASCGQGCPRSDQSLNPIGDKNVRVALLRIVMIRCEHQLLSIRREHRKAIKRRIKSDPLQAAAVHLDHVEIKIASLRISDVRREDY